MAAKNTTTATTTRKPRSRKGQGDSTPTAPTARTGRGKAAAAPSPVDTDTPSTLAGRGVFVGQIDTATNGKTVDQLKAEGMTILPPLPATWDLVPEAQRGECERQVIEANLGAIKAEAILGQKVSGARLTFALDGDDESFWTRMTELTGRGKSALYRLMAAGRVALEVIEYGLPANVTEDQLYQLPATVGEYLDGTLTPGQRKAALAAAFEAHTPTVAQPTPPLTLIEAIAASPAVGSQKAADRIKRRNDREKAKATESAPTKKGDTTAALTDAAAVSDDDKAEVFKGLRPVAGRDIGNLLAALAKGGDPIKVVLHAYKVGISRGATFGTVAHHVADDVLTDVMAAREARTK